MDPGCGVRLPLTPGVFAFSLVPLVAGRHVEVHAGARRCAQVFEAGLLLVTKL